MNCRFTAKAAVGYDCEMGGSRADIMQPKKGGKHRFERIAFLSSGTPEANTARMEFVARYGTIDPESADVVVALGLCTYTSASCAPSGLPKVGDRSRVCNLKVTVDPSGLRMTWKSVISKAPAWKSPAVGYA